VLSAQTDEDHGLVDVTIASAIRTQAPGIGKVEVERRGGGWHVRLYPDRIMVKARAIQQGLTDESISAALACPRFQRSISYAVGRVNSSLGDTDQVHGHETLEPFEDAD
jgi:hypothetical protein